jgi:hypothetical protein
VQPTRSTILGQIVKRITPRLSFRRHAPAILAAALLWPCGAAEARQSLYTYTPDKRPLFHFDLADAGESYETEDMPPEISIWTQGAGELAAITCASDYWASIIGSDAVNAQALTISTGTIDEDNDMAYSALVDSGPFAGMTWLQAGILGLPPTGGSAAMMQNGYSSGEPHKDYLGPMEVLAHNGAPTHRASSVAHELGHALGIMNSAVDGKFSDPLSVWGSHLHDSYNTQAQAGMPIVKGDGTTPTPGAFVLDDTYGSGSGYAFFQGPNTDSVLDGAMLDPSGNIYGVPINGFEGKNPELSHIELKNSMMSHQSYRNWTGYMEAELAMLKDIGYEKINLRNHYGLSIYGSALTVDNTTGYAAVGADGSYLPGVYNTTLMGIGLHIYGTGNTVTQNADILSAGFGGAGIRVDGYNGAYATDGWNTPFDAGNTLSIAPGVRVHSNGTLGTGLMVAYGKGHVIINRGEIAALGQGGVGARFDFGDNMLGNQDSQYRGSWIWTSEGDNQAPYDFSTEGLDGPLVERFDVTGTVAGTAAAIYISENAFVKEINLMRGAELYGDIISNWNPNDPKVQWEYFRADAPITALSFGYMPDSDGEAVSYTPDPNAVHLSE